LTFNERSIFAYRGKEHRTVVELPTASRNLRKIENLHTAWAKKNNKKAKNTRTTEDQPLWYSSFLCCPFHPTHSPPFLRYIWKDELMDCEEQLKQASEAEKDPEKYAAKQTKKDKKLRADFDDES
jgi:hypothetical protein